MSYKKAVLCSVMLMINLQARAENAEKVANSTLETIEVYAQNEQIDALPFAENRKASDVVIKREQLQAKSATLGNALAGERGIHSNPFGGGASAPIIRGQSGARVKILQNGTDVVDMSAISPDHAVAADTL